MKAPALAAVMERRFLDSMVHVEVEAHLTGEFRSYRGVPRGSIFTSLEAASGFFRCAPAGYATTRPRASSTGWNSKQPTGRCSRCAWTGSPLASLTTAAVSPQARPYRTAHS
jgi:hypothetical protein